MKRRVNGMLVATAAGAVMLTAASAEAAFCPPSVDTYRFELNGSSGTAECYAYGNGPMQAGDSGNDSMLNGPAEYPIGEIDKELINFLGKNDSDSNIFAPLRFFSDGEVVDLTDDNVDVSSGTWVLDTTGLTGFNNFIVGFQTGVNGSPSWAAFLLSDKTSGNWAITNPKQGISNYSLYGVVPLPAAAWMMIAGLGVIGGAVKWRRAA